MTDNEFYSILNRCMPNYNLVEKIGTGSFGSVFKCERDGIYYAIKIIPIPANDDELQMLLSRYDLEAVKESLRDKVEKYRGEIKLMSELKGNRSIVNIEDYQIVECNDGLQYHIVIRMELLTSLTSYTSKNALTETEIIQLGIDICDALTVCEKHSVIHRDIKPENIMLHSDGAFKLGDFGVAKQFSKTTVGTIAGTEGFMAPEVSKGQEYTHTADIYSLGILLYYYINNKKMPFVDPDNRSIVAEQEAIIKRMNYSDVLPLPANCSRNLGLIVVKACMYDKECRYRSAADMRADLVKALNGETVTVDLAPASERGTIAQVNEKKNNGETNHGGVKTPFTGDIVDRTSENRAKSRNRTTEAFDEVSKPKKKKKGLTIAVAAVCAVAVGVGGFFVYQKFFAGPEPGIYLDENGNEYEVLSKQAMEEAYNLGVQYAEQGEYQEAIDEFNKVTQYSGKYEDAQAALEKAKTDYQDSLIEKANTYAGNKDYDMAFSMIDTGIAALGDNAKFKEAKDAVLAALKVDYVARAEDQEKSENYDKALECINLVLTYIPDDYELKGMQSRVNAANVAKKALEKAQEYQYKSEYAKLFSSLNKAMDEVTDSTSATATLKMAYDNYMAEYLNLIETQTDDLETVSDYENAVKLLESAVEIFPNDYDLKKQLAETSDMKVAVTAVTDADNYAKKNDYTNLFKTLSKAIDTLSYGSDAAKIVQSSYDKYEKNYITALNERIGTPESVSEYDAAIAEIEVAIKVFPNNNSLTSQLEELKADRPVSLFETNIVDAKRKTWKNNYKSINLSDTNLLYFNQEAKDNFGNKYDNATIIYVGDNTYNSYQTYLTFDCEDYSTLTGVAAIYEKNKNYIGSYKLKIIAQNDLASSTTIYECSFPSGIRPQEINVDITKYSIITIMWDNVGSYYDEWAGLILSDFTLSK